ncbi:MAG: hypothetical protein ACYCQJ_15895 [Nitrososphaerales archaeon]
MEPFIRDQPTGHRFLTAVGLPFDVGPGKVVWGKNPYEFHTLEGREWAKNKEVYVRSCVKVVKSIINKWTGATVTSGPEKKITIDGGQVRVPNFIVTLSPIFKRYFPKFTCDDYLTGIR